MLHSWSVTNNRRVSSDGGRESPLDPLSPRSIVLSVLLGSHPPQMPVGRILEFTSLFDLADGAVRTALSRMVANGDLVNDDSRYRLSDRLLERQAQQDAGRAEPPPSWDGTWWTVAVVRDRRSMAERRAFRSDAIGARLDELRPDLWLRPANIELTTALADVLITRGPMIVGDQRRLVAQLWDLDDLRSRSTEHVEALEAAARRLSQRDDRALADAFAVLAAAQHFLRVEPQLPRELIPDSNQPAVRARYAEVVEAFESRLAQFFAGRSADRISTDAR